MKKWPILVLGALGVLAATSLSTTPVPGSTNPAVTQENIQQTVCVPGYTATIRPSSDYTTKLKKQQMMAWSLKGFPQDYEEDHFISLVLGGNPTDPKNLWPQPYPEARQKDTVENYLHRELCAGRMTLKDAQKNVKNWKPIYEKEFKPVLGSNVILKEDTDDE